MPLDSIKTREQIINILKSRGPSLPIHVSKEIKIESLFASAFLSELASDKMIKISDMKVGGSPLYFLPGQESMLENFCQHLGKEKDAFLLLKEKGILEDSRQDSQTRVSLRNLKDFAFPLALLIDNNKILFWRFHSLPEEEAKIIIEKEFLARHPEFREKELGKAGEIKEKTEEKEEEKKEEKPLDIFQEEKKKPRIRKPAIAKDAFLKEIKEILQKRGIELMAVENFDKREVIARVKKEKECLLFAFNKKKISEKELLKAYKKASSRNLPYLILAKEDISKKMRETIQAYQNLVTIESLEK